MLSVLNFLEAVPNQNVSSLRSLRPPPTLVKDQGEEGDVGLFKSIANDYEKMLVSLTRGCPAFPVRYHQGQPFLVTTTYWSIRITHYHNSSMP